MADMNSRANGETVVLVHGAPAVASSWADVTERLRAADVSRRLVQAIVSGSLVPGKKISPIKVASELGVSHIAQLSPDFIDQVYHWRQILEDEAHRIAVPRLDRSDLARMRKINDRACRAAESQDSRFVSLNREFHFVAFKRAGSEVLLRFLDHLWDAAALYQNTIAVSISRSLLRDEHNALMEAFEVQDVNLVNARMTEHRYADVVYDTGVGTS